jgi:archaemetzincin
MAPDGASLAQAVDLLPVGTLAPPVLQSIAARLSRLIELPVHVLAPDELETRKIAGREQLDAGTLLEAVEGRAVRSGRLLVGLTADDVAVPVFTFVFGLARQGGKACIVSLARADPSFYGLPADPDLRDRRVVSVVVHELGHLAGLEHCTDRACLMSFAGNIERVDTRGSRFCDGCGSRLPRWLRGSAPPPEGV